MVYRREERVYRKALRRIEENDRGMKEVWKEMKRRVKEVLEKGYKLREGMKRRLIE